MHLVDAILAVFHVFIDDEKTADRTSWHADQGVRPLTPPGPYLSRVARGDMGPILYQRRFRFCVPEPTRSAWKYPDAQRANYRENSFCRVSVSALVLRSFV
jgi:hypothetical protein